MCLDAGVHFIQRAYKNEFHGVDDFVRLGVDVSKRTSEILPLKHPVEIFKGKSWVGMNFSIKHNLWLYSGLKASGMHYYAFHEGIDPPIEVCHANSNHPPKRGDCDTSGVERINWCRNILIPIFIIKNKNFMSFDSPPKLMGEDYMCFFFEDTMCLFHIPSKSTKAISFPRKTIIDIAVNEQGMYIVPLFNSGMAKTAYEINDFK